MFLQVLGAVLVIATMWAALQAEGVPPDSCAGERSDSCEGTGVRATHRAALPRRAAGLPAPAIACQTPRRLSWRRT